LLTVFAGDQFFTVPYEAPRYPILKSNDQQSLAAP
jgi:hypothetical protein